MNENEMGRILARSVVRHALGIDDRSGSIHTDGRGIALLEATGSLKRKLDTVGPSESDIAAMMNHRHERRIYEPPGPLLFLKSDVDASSVSVIEIPTLLIHRNVGVRRGAVKFLTELGKRSPICLSDLTRSTLAENCRSIVKSAASTWYIPAENTLRVVENDFMLNVAGLKQSFGTTLKEYQNVYWQAVAFPKVHPARSVASAVYQAATAGDMADDIIEKCSKIPRLVKAVDEFVEQLGHLPFPRSLSLASMIDRRITSRAPRSLFKVLCDLSEDQSPLRSYQGCQALIELWEHWRQSEQQITSEIVSRFVASAVKSDDSTVKGRSAICCRLLAAHFLYWCELHGPILGPDNVTGLAWWLADFVTNAIITDVEAKESPQKYFKSIYSRCLEPALHLSRRIDFVACGVGEPTPFRLLTTDTSHTTPFAARLVASLDGIVAAINPRDPSGKLTAIDEAVLGQCVFPDFGKTQPGSILFTDLKLARETVLEAWSRDIPQFREMIASRREPLARLAIPAELISTMDLISKLSETDQLHAINLILKATQSGTASASTIWNYLLNQEQRKNLFSHLTNENLDYFIQVIMQLPLNYEEPWHRDIPHLFAMLLEENMADDASRELLLTGLLASSVSSSSLSAIKRIRSGPHSDAISNLLRIYCDYLVSNRHHIPCWAWSKLRPFLAYSR